MKKYSFLWILLLAAMLMLSACGKEETTPPTMEAGEAAQSLQDAATEALENGGGITDIMDSINEAARAAADADITAAPVQNVDESLFVWSEGEDGAVIQGFDGEETSIIIPDNINGLPVTEIAEEAFYQSNLTAIELPESVKKIGDSAFYYCTSLVNISMPGVEEIGAYAFDGCMLLRDVTLPDSLTTIRKNAFASCTSLKELSLPSSVVDIYPWAFYASGLETLTVPGSVKEIPGSMLYGCDNLYSVILEDGCEIIYEDAFSNCPSLTALYIPESATDIDEYFVWDFNESLVVYTPEGSAAQAAAENLGLSCVNN